MVSKLLRVPEFCEKWNVFATQIYVLASTKKRDWYVRGLVDESKLLSIRNKRIDLINKAHDYFYDITQKMSETKLAIELSKHSSRTKGSWMQYINKRMFVNFEDFSIIKIILKIKRMKDDSK